MGSLHLCLCSVCERERLKKGQVKIKSKVTLEKAVRHLVTINPLDERREISGKMVGAGVEAYQGQKKVNVQVH